MEPTTTNETLAPAAPKAARTKAAKKPAPPKDAVALVPPPKRSRRRGAAPNDNRLALSNVAQRYYEFALKNQWFSPATATSYLGDLHFAISVIGDLDVRKITEENCLAFLNDTRTTHKRNGREKSHLSIDKTRRAFAQCLRWAVEHDKSIKTSPCPVPTPWLTEVAERAAKAKAKEAKPAKVKAKSVKVTSTIEGAPVAE